MTELPIVDRSCDILIINKKLKVPLSGNLIITPAGLTRLTENFDEIGVVGLDIALQRGTADRRFGIDQCDSHYDASLKISSYSMSVNSCST